MDTATEVRKYVHHAWSKHRAGRSGEPLGYVDGMSLYEYVRSNPADLTDPQGLASSPPADPIEAAPYPIGNLPVMTDRPSFMGFPREKSSWEEFNDFRRVSGTIGPFGAWNMGEYIGNRALAIQEDEHIPLLSAVARSLFLTVVENAIPGSAAVAAFQSEQIHYDGPPGSRTYYTDTTWVDRGYAISAGLFQIGFAGTVAGCAAEPAPQGKIAPLKGTIGDLCPGVPEDSMFHMSRQPPEVLMRQGIDAGESWVRSGAVLKYPVVEYQDNIVMKFASAYDKNVAQNGYVYTGSTSMFIEAAERNMAGVVEFNNATSVVPNKVFSLYSEPAVPDFATPPISPPMPANLDLSYDQIKADL